MVDIYAIISLNLRDEERRLRIKNGMNRMLDLSEKYWKLVENEKKKPNREIFF